MISNAQQSNEQFSSKEGATKISDDMKKTDLAINLLRYGYQNNSSVSLAQAAQMLFELNMGQLTFSEVTGESKSEQPLNMSVTKLLQDALTMSEGDAETRAYVESVKTQIDNKPINKGARNGPVRKSARVAANSTVAYALDIAGGEVMTIAVYGDGDTDLDLYVYNEIGDLRAYDDDPSGDCLVMFLPLFSQKIRIEIKNRGSIYNDFVIVTN